MPELVAVRAQPARGQPVAARQPHVLGLEARDERAHPLAVLREARVVAAVALDHARRRWRGRRRRRARRSRGTPPVTNASRSPSGASERYANDAQPAEALAEHAPALDAQRLAQQLGVAHDRVGAEVRQVRRRSRSRAPASSARCRAGRAAARGSPSARGPASPGRAGCRSAATPRSPARPAGRPGTASRAPPARRPRARRP